MITTPVARRYAKALFETATAEERAPIRQTVTDLSETFEHSADLRNVLLSPLYHAEEKRGILLAIIQRLNGTERVSRFLLYVLEHNRLPIIPEISEAFANLVDQAGRRVSIVVTTHRRWNDDDRRTMRRRLQEITRQDVEVTFHVAPEVIGGIIVRVGSWVFDGSVRAQLSRWKTALVRE